MMNPADPQVKHFSTTGPRPYGVRAGQRAASPIPRRAVPPHPSGLGEGGQLRVVVRPSTSQVPPTLAIDTVAWFLKTTGVLG